MSESAYTIRRADWEQDRQALSLIRERVFITEQQVPQELEWDGLDPGAAHLLALDSANNPIGTVRLLSDGHIGRMAVDESWRGRGVGSALLEAIIGLAHDTGMSRVFLDAQTHAIPFYQRHGFRAEGEIFLDAGIPHRHMTRGI